MSITKGADAGRAHRPLLNEQCPWSRKKGSSRFLLLSLPRKSLIHSLWSNYERPGLLVSASPACTRRPMHPITPASPQSEALMRFDVAPVQLSIPRTHCEDFLAFRLLSLPTPPLRAPDAHACILHYRIACRRCMWRRWWACPRRSRARRRWLPPQCFRCVQHASSLSTASSW